MSRHTLVVHAPGLEDVLEKAYELAFFERHDRPYFKSLGPGDFSSQTSNWALDMRVPLSRSDFLRPIAAEMVSCLSSAGLCQVAGYGYGSFPLVGAIVGQADMMTGAFIRQERKPYGFGEIVEGELRRDLPVVIVDDLLGAGRSALHAAAALRAEGFTVTAVYTVFRFSWRPGRHNLRAERLSHRCLATLRQNAPTEAVPGRTS